MFYICKTHSVHFQGSGMNLTPYILLTLELATAARTSAAFTALEHVAAQKSRCPTFGIKLDLFTKSIGMFGWDTRLICSGGACVCTPLKTASAPSLIADRSDKWVSFAPLSWSSGAAWRAPRSRRALTDMHNFSLNHSGACLGRTSLYRAPWLAISHSRLCCLWQADMSGQADRWTGGEMEWFLWATD